MAIANSKASLAEETSLFFSDSSLLKIESLREKLPQPSVDQDNTITLGAIIFHDTKNWTLWLNDVQWTPETISSDIRILDVNADSVRLSIDKDSNNSLIATLKPDQSINKNTGEISGGKL